MSRPVSLRRSPSAIDVEELLAGAKAEYFHDIFHPGNAHCSFPQQPVTAR